MKTPGVTKLRMKFWGKVIPALSYLPDRVILWFDKLPFWEHDDIGWSFWMDVSYYRYWRTRGRIIE